MGTGKTLRDTVHAMVAAAALLSVVGAQAACAQSNAQADALSELRQRPPQDEVIYFALPDRFANGDPSNDSVAALREAALRGDTELTRAAERLFPAKAPYSHATLPDDADPAP